MISVLGFVLLVPIDPACASAENVLWVVKLERNGDKYHLHDDGRLVKTMSGTVTYSRIPTDTESDYFFLSLYRMPRTPGFKVMHFGGELGRIKCFWSIAEVEIRP